MIGDSGIGPTPPPGSSCSAVSLGDVGCHGGQSADSLVLEHVLCRQGQPAGLGAGHELYRQDAVAAEREEAVVGTHRSHPSTSENSCAS